MVAHRQKALRDLTAMHATTFGTHPRFHLLLPFAHDETISKRAWEHKLYVVRSLLHHIHQHDRMAARNFVLDYYDDLLQRRPALHDALPDPAEDRAIDEWARVFLAAVHSIMTAL